MLPVVVETLLVGIVGLALLLYLGGGLALLLPAALAPYRWLVAPWLGYCLLSVLTQFLTNAPVDVALTALESCYAALGMVTVVYAYAATRTRLLRRGGLARLFEGDPAEGRYLWWVVLISFGVFVLCLLPVWSYGYTTVIGENWDAEIYMGLGEYLKDYSQSGLAASAPNPILDTLVNPPYGLRTHGFSYFHAALGFLPLDSLQTLAPTLALVRALSIPAAYAFFRVGMGLRPAPSLAACVALGLNAFLLWVTYNTFGMQVPAFGLLPLAVCAALILVRGASAGRGANGEAGRAVVLTALLVAGMAVTYHPVLTAYLALVGPVVAVWVVLHRRGALWVVYSLATAATLAVLFSFVSQAKSLEGFIKQYSERTGGLGLTGFTSPADAFGFALSFRDLLPPDPGRPLYSLLLRLYGVAGWLALVAALGLVAFYLYRLWRYNDGATRNRFFENAALVAGAVAYGLLFLWPLNYPYGWFKALSFVSFVLVGAAVGGLAVGSPEAKVPGPKSRVQSRLERLWTRDFGLGTLAVLMLVTTALTVRIYWGEPLRFNREMIEVRAVRETIREAEGEQDVYVSNSPNMQRLGRLYNGLLSYYLRYADLYGEFETANSRLDREKASGVYRFALLHADDSPTEYGVAGGRLAWHNSLMSLYELPPSGSRKALFHYNYRDAGTFPQVSRDQELFLTVEPERITLGDQPPPQDAISVTKDWRDLRRFSFGFASFVTATLRLVGPGSLARGIKIDEIEVPPGYSLYQYQVMDAPDVVELALATTPGSEGDIFVRWVHLGTLPGPEGIQPDGPGLLARIASAREGDNIALAVDYLHNRPGVVSQTLSLDIYGTGRGNAAHFGYWNVDVPANAPLNLHLELDPASKALTLREGDAATLAGSFQGETGDGSYTASLLVYENGQVAETFNDIFTFDINDGKLETFKPRDLQPLFR